MDLKIFYFSTISIKYLQLVGNPRSMNTNTKLQINLIQSLVIFFLVTGFCFSCEKYGIRFRGKTADVNTTESFFSGLLSIQDCLPGFNRYEEREILWNAIASTANEGGKIFGETMTYAANEGGAILWKTITLAANKGGEILWKTIAYTANEGGTILWKMIAYTAYEGRTILWKMNASATNESLLTGDGSTDGDGETAETEETALETVATYAHDDTHDNDDEISGSDAFLCGSFTIYIDTININVYNYFENK